LDLWRLGVEAGRKAIGEAAFKEYAGELWGFLEARPYMRTRFGLAEALWKRGRHEEAVDDLSELLALNPNDNQGIRYALLAHLAEMRRDDETAALLGRYGDEYSAFWAWTRVLLAFRRSGDDAAACAQLGEAVKVNPHVRDYLCGERRVPREMPPYYGPGDKDEAILYVADYRLAWQETPGAVDWLKTKAPTTLKTRRRAARKH
jgi:tetratricopeptide (TPR) repeat protein